MRAEQPAAAPPARTDPPGRRLGGRPGALPGARLGARPGARLAAWLGARPGDGPGLRRQLVGIGLAGIVLHLVLVGSAVIALIQVNTAHAAVDRITAAQAVFQDADMAHDAIRGDALALLLTGASADDIEAIRDDVADFRTYLDTVELETLPDEIEVLLREVRPLQDRYADEALGIAEVVAVDRQEAMTRRSALTAQFDVLIERQGAITAAMSREADRLQGDAREAEREVAWLVGASAVAALLGMLALTVLLHRLGGALSTTLARERGVAETLQHRLLPDRLPDLPGVRLAARYVPGAVGSQVGGDWYDVIPLPSGEVGLVMGDVVGHDLDAAADMGQLHNALRACAAEGARPDVVLQQLNRLCLQQDLGGMATVLYAVLDPVLGTLRMANAGHYPPLLVSADGSRFLECDACPPVGAVREVHYTSSVHELPAGSLLVLYTDGLVERRDAPVEDGLARLRSLVPEAVDGDGLEGLCDAVIAGMRAGSPSDDDIALLTVAPQAVLGPHLAIMLPAEAEQLVVLRRTLERWLVEAGASDVEVYEITVACSEAATNAIEHAYGPGRADLEVVCDVTPDGWVTMAVRDWGQWREARGRDRGRGVGLIRGLMDEADVRHGDRGTQVLMRRRLAAGGEADLVAAARPVERDPSSAPPRPRERAQGVDA